MRAAHALRGGLLRLQAAAPGAAGRQSEVGWHGLASALLPTSGPAATTLRQHAQMAAAAVLHGGLRNTRSHSDAAVASSVTVQATDPDQQQLQALPQQASQQQQQQQQAAIDKKQRRRQQRRGGGKGGSSSSSSSSGDAALQTSTDPAERLTSKGEGKGRPRGGARGGPPTAAAAEAEDSAPEAAAAPCPLPPARVLQDDAHPIREADISRPAWAVLSRLRAAGALPLVLPPAAASA